MTPGDLVVMTILIVVAALTFYVCCFSPMIQKIGDEVFYDPLESEVARYEAKYEKEIEENE